MSTKEIGTGPTPTACWLEDFGAWFDNVNGQLTHWPGYTDETWYDEPLGVDFACVHMIEQVNAAIGSTFDADDFADGCECHLRKKEAS